MLEDILIGLNVTNTCASFCRHCQRRRNFGSVDCKITKASLNNSLKYIREHKEIRDVLITGGDALSLSDEELEQIIGTIRSYNHVEIIRIGTRMPVNLPQRITPQLVNMLSQVSSFVFEHTI